jgi:hypothetical protein
MDQVTPVDEVMLSEESYLSLLRVIADLRRQVDALKNDAASGGKIDTAEATKAVSKLNEVIVACNRTENRLHECRNKQAGIARGGYALDLERARADIGCKLDRLRQCGDPGAIPR